MNHSLKFLFPYRLTVFKNLVLQVGVGIGVLVAELLVEVLSAVVAPSTSTLVIRLGLSSSSQVSYVHALKEKSKRI